MSKKSTRDSSALQKEQSKTSISTIKSLKAVSFNNSKLEILEYNGQQYIAGRDIEKALEYKSKGKVAELYSNYKDEFDPDMSVLVNSATLQNMLYPDSGYSSSKVYPESGYIKYAPTLRLYNRRGAYLIAMLSKTSTAKHFRKWVLDILETHQQSQTPQLTLSSTQLKELNIFKKQFSKTLIFNNIPVEVVDTQGQEWILSRSINQILNYKDVNSVNSLYQNHKRKFHLKLTKLVNIAIIKNNLPFIHQSRVFSLEGAHLIVALSEKPLARQLQAFLLEKIESQAINKAISTIALKKVPTELPTKKNPFANLSYQLTLTKELIDSFLLREDFPLSKLSELINKLFLLEDISGVLARKLRLQSEQNPN